VCRPFVVKNPKIARCVLESWLLTKISISVLLPSAGIYILLPAKIWQAIHFRPLDIVLGGLVFIYVPSVFSFIRQLPSELTKRKSTKTGHMFGSECDLKTYVQHLRYPLPLKKSAAQNRLFSTFFDDSTT